MRKVALASLLLLALPALASAQTGSQQNTEFQGPATKPPGGNKGGVLYLQDPTQPISGLLPQTAALNISGPLGTSDNLYITNNHGLRVDQVGGATAKISNTNGAQALILNLVGGMQVTAVNPVITPVALGNDGRVQAAKFCFNPGTGATDCITAWPGAGGGGLYVLKAGDTMTGTLNVTTPSNGAAAVVAGVIANGHTAGVFGKTAGAPRNSVVQGIDVGVAGEGDSAASYGGEFSGKTSGAIAFTDASNPQSVGFASWGNEDGGAFQLNNPVAGGWGILGAGGMNDFTDPNLGLVHSYGGYFEGQYGLHAQGEQYGAGGDFTNINTTATAQLVPGTGMAPPSLESIAVSTTGDIVINHGYSLCFGNSCQNSWSGGGGAGAYVPLAGGNMTGELNLNTSAATPYSIDVQNSGPIGAAFSGSSIGVWGNVQSASALAGYFTGANQGALGSDGYAAQTEPLVTAYNTNSYGILGLGGKSKSWGGTFIGTEGGLIAKANTNGVAGQPNPIGIGVAGDFENLAAPGATVQLGLVDPAHPSGVSVSSTGNIMINNGASLCFVSATGVVNCSNSFAAGGGSYVAKAGDTMTGALNITLPSTAAGNIGLNVSMPASKAASIGVEGNGTNYGGWFQPTLPGTTGTGVYAIGGIQDYKDPTIPGLTDHSYGGAFSGQYGVEGQGNSAGAGGYFWNLNASAPQLATVELAVGSNPATDVGVSTTGDIVINAGRSLCFGNSCQSSWGGGGGGSYVAKAGDTMTGALSITTSANAPSLVVNESPASNQQPAALINSLATNEPGYLNPTLTLNQNQSSGGGASIFFQQKGTNIATLGTDLLTNNTNDVYLYSDVTKQPLMQWYNNGNVTMNNPSSNLTLNTTVNDSPTITLNKNDVSGATSARTRIQFTHNKNAGMELGSDYNLNGSSDNLYIYDRNNNQPVGLFSGITPGPSGVPGYTAVAGNGVASFENLDSAFASSISLFSLGILTGSIDLNSVTRTTWPSSSIVQKTCSYWSYVLSGQAGPWFTCSCDSGVVAGYMANGCYTSTDGYQTCGHTWPYGTYGVQAKYEGYYPTIQLYCLVNN